MPFAMTILAGGASRRMGRNKALLPWRGATLVATMIATARAAGAEEIVISGPPDLYGNLNLPCVPDRWPGCGPLGGIASVLAASTAPRILAVGCDMPFLPPALLRWLWDLPAPTGAWVVPASASDRLEPLCAIYDHGLLPAMEAAIATGAHKIDHALANALQRVVSPVELAAAGFAPGTFQNLNEPQTYQKALASIRKQTK